MPDFDARLDEMGLELPPAAKPMGAYAPLVEVDRWVYVSGHGPLLPSGALIMGRVGVDLDVEEAYGAARQTGLAIIASLRQHLGGLNRIDRLVKLLGMVSCVPEFVQQPAVINGCSELFQEVFGEAGVAARSAVGVAALPAGMAVEIEAIFHLKS